MEGSHIKDAQKKRKEKKIGKVDPQKGIHLA